MNSLMDTWEADFQLLRKNMNKVSQDISDLFGEYIGSFLMPDLEAAAVIQGQWDNLLIESKNQDVQLLDLKKRFKEIYKEA